MNPNISVENYSKFITSFGALLAVGGIFSFVYMVINNLKGKEGTFFTLYGVTFLIGGFGLMLIGLKGLQKLEDAEIRYKQEKAIREILEQDYLLAKIKLAYKDLNQKTKDENKELSEDKKKSYEEPRGMESIAKQVFNLEFYEETYGLGKKKKVSFWKRLFKKKNEN